MSKDFIKGQHRRTSFAILGAMLTMLVLSACGDSTATTIPPTTAAVTTAASTTAAATTAATTTVAGTTAAATTSSATTAAGTTAVGTTSAATIAAGTTSAATTAASTTPAGTTAGSGTTAASTSGDTTPKVVAATTAFLATLDATQKAAVQFDWSNTTQKQKWSNFPEGLFSRSGIMWGNMTDAQKTAWLAVMSTTLSKAGYTRVMNEWNADDALAASSGGGNLSYGKQYYWIAIIGTPSATTPWQWQWGGHHVTVNATIQGTNISLNPSFIGDQPATYTDSSGATIRPLGDIDDTAIALLNSLDATEKTKAVLGTTSIDLVLGPGEDGKKIASEGLKGSDMTTEQQNTLLTLMSFYGNLVNEEDAVARIADLKSHLADTYFVWYGSTTNPKMGYWRVTGPTIVVEYSPQSMGGDSSEHIHGIYRDPTNDYGAAFVTQ